MKNKVGFIFSGGYVVDELKLSFGLISPTNLPLKNKLLFDHQLEFLKKRGCNKVYLVIPENYHIKIHENQLYSKNSSSLIDTFKLIPSVKEDIDVVEILYGDSLVDLEPVDIDSNIVGYGKSDFDYDWGLKIDDKVPVGYFHLNFNILNNLLKSSSTFNILLEKLLSNELIIPKNVDNWLDFGHNSSFYSSRKKFLETRHFNEFKLINNFICKKSNDYFKMFCEYKWLNEMKNRLPSNIPYVYDFKLFNGYSSYKIEYLNYPSINEMIVFGNFSYEFEKDLVKKLIIITEKIGSPSLNNNIISDSFISKKLVKRKNKIIELYSDLEHMVDECVSYFHNKKMYYSTIHGDLCYSNILYNKKDNQFILIDPRGYLDDLNGFQMQGPVNYDLYKIGHSFICAYDQIIFNQSLFDVDIMRDRFSWFCKLTNISSEEMKYGLLQLFLSMIPLHSNRIDRQNKFHELCLILYKIT